MRRSAILGVVGDPVAGVVRVLVLKAISEIGPIITRVGCKSVPDERRSRIQDARARLKRQGKARQNERSKSGSSRIRPQGNGKRITVDGGDVSRGARSASHRCPKNKRRLPIEGTIAIVECNRITDRRSRFRSGIRSSIEREGAG